MSSYLDFNETPVVLSALAKSGKTSTLVVFFVVDVIVMFLSHLSSVSIFANLRIGSCSSCWMGREHYNI